LLVSWVDVVNEEVLQAGCIVRYRSDVILRRTAKGEWVFPKGHVEAGETPAEAAVREVAEETGLMVAIDRPVGAETFTLNRERRRVIYFLADVVEELPEWNEHRGRDAFPVPAPEVRQRLSFENSRALWDNLSSENKEKEQP
jgi:8-oxo-dGTP pyrophosphatase MutT (NUDIX family)